MDKKKLVKQYTPRPKLQSMTLAKMEPVSYKSSDGLEIPAYLVLPAGKEPKNLPAIVLPHGGPWARDYWGYNSYAQFLANRGYAVLLPNFRGSTGYGKKFLNAGNGEWGQKMQDDITWGVKYLVGKGIADPKRVGIMGGSYGGYATLAGLAFTPDVYAAGVDIVGPSNLITLLNSIPPYWESIRKVFNERMGDPNTPEGKARLEKQSPLFSAKSIKAPLLVVQGANDPRVKKAESDQIVSALRELDIPVEYINAPDEGHGFRDAVNSMAMLAYTEKFLAKHLNGRYQSSMKPEVEERLKKITVDVSTVEDPTKTPESKIERIKPVSDLKEGTFNYAATITAGEQKINMEMAREIKSEEGNWLITETSKTPMGDIVDQNLVSKNSLAPVQRKIKQGPANIEVNYAESEITGSMAMNGQNRPIQAKLEHPVISDGAGMDLIIARLPLKENYQTTIGVFDVMTSKVKKMQVKVLGTEKITVPAGAFDTWKVSVSEVDGPSASTLWIAPDSRNTIKIESNIPQMGNGKLLVELMN
jgi:dienelactone hydrolase